MHNTLKGILVLIWFISAGSLTAADRPNIIFVLCDDLGAGDIGVLWQNAREGTQKFSTPNLDQFARGGNDSFPSLLSGSNMCIFARLAFNRTSSGALRGAEYPV